MPRAQSVFVVLAAGLMILMGLPARAGQTTAENHDQDRSAIAQSVQRFMDSWNLHDAHALSLSFTEDTDFTNAFGTHNQGRGPIEATYGPMMAGAFKETRQTGTIRSIRFLAPGVAQVDVDWQMTGVRNPEGSMRATRHGLLSWVMAKQSAGSWLIEIMHMNEFTSQTTPPAATAAKP